MHGVKARTTAGIVIAVIFLTVVSVSAMEVEIEHQPGAIDVFITSGPATLAVTDGLAVPEVDGCEPHSTPGAPVLPLKAFTLAIPPDADEASVTVTVEGLETELMELPEGTRVQPGPPVAFWDGTKSVEVWDNPSQIVDGFDMTVYGADALYPDFNVAGGASGNMRKWSIASIAFYPVRYNPVAGLLEVVRTAHIRVSFAIGKEIVPEEVMNDTVMDGEAAQRFDNIGQALEWYPRPADKTKATTYEYVIMTTDAIMAATNHLKALEYTYASRFKVLAVTETRTYTSLSGPNWYVGGWGGGSGNTAADNMRQWLRTNYISMGIQYVLLVGDPRPDVGTLPMKIAQFHSAYYNQAITVPTDTYYSELTGNWDLNGNGVSGEWPQDHGPGGIDTFQEVLVGRIPVFANDSNRIASLESILAKNVGYAAASSDNLAWRKRVMLVTESLDAATNNACVMECIRTDHATPAGWPAYRIYDADYGYAPELTPCTVDNVEAVWKTGTGLVVWSTHGSPRSASHVFHTDRCPNLDNTKPSIVFQGSCLNGSPYSNDNLGFSLLKNGAIATVSGTEVTFYRVGDCPGALAKGMNGGLARNYAKEIISGKTVGRAIKDIKDTMALNVSINSYLWQNWLTYVLYGDPAVNVLATGGGAPNIGVEPASVVIEANKDFDPPLWPLTISAQGGGVLAYSVRENVDWLEVTPSTGISFGDAFMHVIKVNSASKPVGTYLASITVEAPGAANSPRNILVTLNVKDNDDFANRRQISGTSGYETAMNHTATLEPGEPAHALTPHGKSLWFSWTPYSNARVYMDTGVSTFDTVLAVYTGNTLATLSLVARDYEKLSFVPVSGNHYRIAVAGRDYGSGAQSGTVLLEWEQVNAAANDPFSGAIPITGLSGTETGDNRGATRQTGEPSHAGASSGFSLWWAYQWNQSVPLVVTLDTVGSTFDTVLAVYTGTAVNALTPVASNDNYEGGGRTSHVTFTVQPGVNYKIAVDGIGETWEDIVGSVKLNWSAVPTDAVDNFNDTTLIGGVSGRSTGYTGTATKEPGEPNHAGNAGGKSIWWAFEAPNYLFGGYGTKITFSTAGSDFDTLLAVYRGSNIASLTLVASNDDAHGTSQSEVSFNMDHDLYFIAVDGYKPPTGIAASGNAILSWNVNDAFADSLGLPSWDSGLQDCANGGATAEPNEPAHGGQPARHSTWFHWTAPQTGSVRFGYQGNFTPLMGAYTGTTLSGLQEVAYTERSGATMRFCASVGTTYRIAVDGETTGSFQIGWTMDMAPRRLAAFIAEGDGRLQVNGVHVDGYYEGDFAACQSVELRALKTSPQWTFKRWAGDIESTNAVIQVPVGKDMEVRAHYEITACQLVAECHGPGDIRVDGVWSGSRYEEWLPIGTTVQVRADAAPGFAFLRWNGSVVSTDNPVEVTLDDSMRIYVEFMKLEKVRLYPDRDATLYADPAGSTANGSGEWLFAGKEYDALRKALVRFDLEGLFPADAAVQRVDFYLYYEPHTFSENMPLNLIKVGQDWGEGASDAAGDESLGAPAQPGDATWLHSSHDTVFWTVPGGTTLGDFSGTMSIGNSPTRHGCYSTAPGNAQMLTDVQLWIDHPEQNFGWMIVDDGAPEIKRFGSRQNSTQWKWPMVDITYTTYYPGNTTEPDCTKRFSLADLPVTIPPGEGASVTINVEESVVIQDLNVEISLDTDYIDGISLYLYSPEGYEVVLVENVRKTGSYFTGTIFNDEAIQSIHAGTDPFTGDHRPDSPLFSIDGENTQGEWELYIENINGYRAVLSEFTLCITPEEEEEPVVPHPADLNEDFKLVLSEAIGYLAGWQQGSNPIGHAIRAAYLWQNGENYTYNSEAAEPMCWELIDN